MNSSLINTRGNRAKKAIIALKWVCKEMERRYSLMNEENTRSLEGITINPVENFLTLLSS